MTVKILAAVLGFAMIGVQAQSQGKRQIYPESANPQTSIADGLKQARLQHKRVLIDFGGDWCGDCQVLDIYFHQGANLALLQQNYILVHVWVPETLDKNVEVGHKYGVWIEKGVPALAVLDADGKVVYSQHTSQFNDMRHMDPGAVNAFLNRWKG